MHVVNSPCTPLQDGCTALHAAVRSGHVDTLRLLLCHPTQGDPTVTPEPPATPALPAALLNQANNDGWTAAHMAAALGLKVRMSRQKDVITRNELTMFNVKGFAYRAVTTIIHNTAENYRSNVIPQAIL